LVVNLLTAKAVMDGQITVFGGDQWRPFLHVDDAASAILRVLEASLSVVGNQIFNVGCNAQNYTINEVARIIHHHVPSAQLVNMGLDRDKRNYRVNFRKIEARLGFQPQWTIDYGINQVVNLIRSGKIHDYHDAQYSNAKSLSEMGASRLRYNENDWARHLLDEPTVASEPHAVENGSAAGSQDVVSEWLH
jgi:dTDP-D-glucose 4,6-dehydratase